MSYVILQRLEAFTYYELQFPDVISVHDLEIYRFD